MPRKWILCRCEDVTVADVEHAVATGFTALEEVKRYTGFGTGPCQGKECLRAVVLALAEATGVPPEDLLPFTARPPLAPTELKWFAPAPAGHDNDDERPSPPPGLAPPDRADR